MLSALSLAYLARAEKAAAVRRLLLTLRAVSSRVGTEAKARVLRRVLGGLWGSQLAAPRAPR